VPKSNVFLFEATKDIFRSRFNTRKRDNNILQYHLFKSSV